jgi:hypothetical protein
MPHEHTAAPPPSRSKAHPTTQTEPSVAEIAELQRAVGEVGELLFSISTPAAVARRCPALAGVMARRRKIAREIATAEAPSKPPARPRSFRPIFNADLDARLNGGDAA